MKSKKDIADKTAGLVTSPERSLHRMVRPVCDVRVNVMRVLEKARHRGSWGIAVMRDPEALLWQMQHEEVGWLLKGLHALASYQSPASSSGANPSHGQSSSGAAASGNNS